MKKALISLSVLTLVLTLVLTFTSCGPAAEDRFKMKETANHVSDSIGKAIDAALAQGAIPGTATTTVVDTTKNK